MLSSNEDAEDVLQEVFAASFNAICADERPINARPWLYRIARNRCLNHLRRPSATGQDSMDIYERDGGVTTADTVHRREEFRQIVADVGELPETQRTALLLREIDALSYDQIAEAMDTTVPSVKSLLVRARVSLAEAAEARLLTCQEVRLELGQVAEGLTTTTAPVRRHLKACERCRVFKGELRKTSKALAAIYPIGPIVILKKLLVTKLGAGAAAGGSGAAAGSTAAGGATIATGGAGVAGGMAGSSAVSAGIGAVASKAAAGLAAAAIVTAGAVEVKRVAVPVQQAPAQVARVPAPVAKAVPLTVKPPAPPVVDKAADKPAPKPAPEPKPAATVPVPVAAEPTPAAQTPPADPVEQDGSTITLQQQQQQSDQTAPDDQSQPPPSDQQQSDSTQPTTPPGESEGTPPETQPSPVAGEPNPPGEKTPPTP